MKYLKLLSIFALLLSFTACVNRNKKNVVQENEPNTVQQELLSNGWKFYTPENGDLPAAYGINPVRGLLDNYFDIEMGTGLNLAVKIVDAQTNKTIRYVFVREKTKANMVNNLLVVLCANKESQPVIRNDIY